MRTIYIAGPMRGIRHFNFPAFDHAKETLADQGWKVISPADLDRDQGFDETDFPEEYDWIDLKAIGFSLHSAVDRDVNALKVCDAIYMLDGWEKSKGALAEKALAEWLGLEVVYQTPPKNIPVQEGQTVVNEKGGKQSHLSARFDCLPPEVLRLLAQCLGFGAAKYGKENWRNIELEDNLAHAMNHINEWRRGDRSEPHLVNTLARVTFAVSLAVTSGDQPPEYHHPDMTGK